MFFTNGNELQTVGSTNNIFADIYWPGITGLLGMTGKQKRLGQPDSRNDRKAVTTGKL